LQRSFGETYFAKNVEICLCFFGRRNFLRKPYQDLDFSKIDDNDVRCPDAETAEKMIAKLKKLKKKATPLAEL
jgi:chorismate synthase